MTRILLVEDHQIMREGLRMLLANDHTFEVVGEAENGLQALKLAEYLKPHVMIIDIMLPELNGLEVIRKVHQRYPQIKLLVLSMYTDEAYVFEALRHGAHAYVLKHASASDLTYAIREVLAGGTYLSAPLSERAIAQYLERANEQPQNRYDLLTSREREVLQLVAEGLTNAAVAERLQISSRTAEVHRMNLMRKLDLNSHTDLVRYAIRRGIIPLDS